MNEEEYLKILNKNSDGKNLIVVNYDAPFDDSERISFFGEFEKDRYVRGVKNLLHEGECRIIGIGGAELSISKNGNVSIEMRSGSFSIGTRDSLEKILDVLKFCNYCSDPVFENHYVSKNDLHYCNGDCFRMYTED